jgi:hypothetical protein
MPRTAPNGMEAWLAKQGGGNIRPVVLADIQTTDGTQYFWSDREDYFPTKFVLGTRVQTSGGTSTLKYFLDFGLAANATAYRLRAAVKNNAAVPLVVSSQYNSTTLQPGESRQIVLNFNGSGALDAQFRFETQSVGDAIDCVAYAPFVGRVDTGANLIATNKLNFSAWNTFNGSAATITQAYDVAPFALYSGWIKNGFNFTRTRDLSTNAGDLVVQNLSGNTIVRDVSSALDAHEFEGALCVLRLWLPLFDAVMDEFHCSLSEPSPAEDEASFRLLTLLDPSQYFCADDPQGELCSWRFKSAQCGSTADGTVCDKTMPTCQDVHHAAQERFNGILATVPGNIFAQSTHTGGGGGGGPDDEPGGGPNGPWGYQPLRG